MKLEILLYGLLALVPRPDTKQIDVILMDTEGKKSSDSCEIHRHAPFFAFSPAEGECGAACPEASLTKLFRGREAGVDKLCVCDLEAGLLTFTGLVPPAQAFSVPSRPATVTKANQAHAGWILRISDAVAQASLADPSKLDKEAARVTLPLGGLSTCMLANFDTVNGIETYKVQLRDLHGGPAVGSIRPVAEVIKVSTDREAKVHVRLGGADGGLLCNARGCGGAFLANESPHSNAEGYCHDWRVGRHFDQFYRLAKRPPTFQQEPVPHLVGQPIPDLDLTSCSMPVMSPAFQRSKLEIATPFYRPMCPPALFNGVSQ